MTDDDFHIRPTTTFWQRLEAGWPDGNRPPPPYRYAYPVALPDGRVLHLPLRRLPTGDHAVASFIANQAAFPVVAALTDHMAVLARRSAPQVVVGLPTLGLSFAPGVAERLGQSRYVPLGYSRKFWYDDALSVPINSLTSPDGLKRLYLDPNVLDLLRGRRICLVDDAVSTGSSVIAALRLLRGLDLDVAGVVVAMKQTRRWAQAVRQFDPSAAGLISAVMGCPLFRLAADGWVPVEDTLPDIP